MNYKYLLRIYLLVLFNVWTFQKFVRAEIERNSISIPNDIIHSELTAQLEVLITGNEFLKLRLGTMQMQLDKQKELWQSLENKLDKLAITFQSIDNKILKQSEQHLNEATEMIYKQNQLLQSKYQTPPVDDKWQIIGDIKEIIKSHESISDINTQALGDRILKNLTFLQNIDKNLTRIETAIAAKTNQIELNRSMQKYFNKNEPAKICLKSDDKKLICTTPAYPTNCADFNDNHCSNNKCRIYNYIHGPDPFLVSCDDQTEGGGWTVIQRRINGSVDFYRNWSEYKDGFGHIDGEFFIGLDKLSALTTSLEPVELLIQLQDFNDTSKYAKYAEFHVANETENYKLNKVGKYSGNAGDSFSQHKGLQFTTKDRNNAEDKNGNCAEIKTGAWWYESCMWSNLNGMYHNNGKVTSSGKGICWNNFHGYMYSLKYVQMSIRPRRI